MRKKIGQLTSKSSKLYDVLWDMKTREVWVERPGLFDSYLKCPTKAETAQDAMHVAHAFFSTSDVLMLKSPDTGLRRRPLRGGLSLEFLASFPSDEGWRELGDAETFAKRLSRHPAAGSVVVAAAMQAVLPLKA